MHFALLRQRQELPAPMLIPPPVFMQVSVPSTLTNPGPYTAQELL